MTVFDDMQAIFHSADFYNPSGSPQMTERQAALQRVEQGIRALLPPSISIDGENASLAVDTGGFHGSYSPVPWVRVFSPRYSPRPAEGFYLAYLFAADGSGVYLSLNHGTSEYRANKWRPITSAARIREQALDARRLFDTWSPNLLDDLTPEINLANGPNLGVESRRRTGNYEAANVYAVYYPASTAVSDAGLYSGLERMLALLQRVYFEAALPEGVTGAGSATVVDSGGSGQARVTDSRLNKAVEGYSMRSIMEKYAATGEWDVEDVSRYRSYDIELTRKADKAVVHVEVKGTASAGVTVFLTRNEVDLARTFDHTVLAIVHDIKIERYGDEIRCSGGHLREIDPWVPSDDRLAPTQYTYTVPQQLCRGPS